MHIAHFHSFDCSSYKKQYLPHSIAEVSSLPGDACHGVVVCISSLTQVTKIRAGLFILCFRVDTLHSKTLKKSCLARGGIPILLLAETFWLFKMNSELWLSRSCHAVKIAWRLTCKHMMKVITVQECHHHDNCKRSTRAWQNFRTILILCDWSFSVFRLRICNRKIGEAYHDLHQFFHRWSVILHMISLYARFFCVSMQHPESLQSSISAAQCTKCFIASEGCTLQQCIVQKAWALPPHGLNHWSGMLAQFVIPGQKNKNGMTKKSCSVLAPIALHLYLTKLVLSSEGTHFAVVWRISVQKLRKLHFLLVFPFPFRRDPDQRHGLRKQIAKKEDRWRFASQDLCRMHTQTLQAVKHKSFVLSKQFEC